MGVIDDFLARYRKEYDFYDQAARIAAQSLEGRLQAAGVRSIVTSRAKSVNRLEPKVRHRDTRKTYASADDIYNDVVDLAGVRVALYFPAQRDQVDTLVRQLFAVSEQKNFPDASTPKYEKRFSGYWAIHYRVNLREALLSEAQKRYAEARIEIQVASVLMHAWSEVEHDLVYKPLQGGLSGEEYAILDELNGLVITGEIALERLERAGQARVAAGGRRFGNHYELAAFLLENSVALHKASAIDQGLGTVDLLFELLVALDLLTPDALKPYVIALDADLDKRPISEQVVDQLLAENAARYPIYERVRANRPGQRDEVSPDSPSDLHEALGFFMAQWIDFEREVRGKIWRKSAERGPPVPSPHLLQKAGLIDQATSERLEPIRRLRNDVVHGVSDVEPSELESAGKRLKDITRDIASRPAPAQQGDALDGAVRRE